MSDESNAISLSLDLNWKLIKL